ncbi:conserved hypothetical protein [Hyphomicrobiales bacterium]|nr:conserved hypothetical protein [Hyphomicrobiales bacterium]CAH1702527.1 hypothetical protein BOSEA1005_30399 [Hyphomicrobiales bacterium]CAI0346729.1 conserved hypothetical protein [Hyphomicrobiales bacterium]
MQITFNDDGRGDIRVVTLADGRELARLVEAADGSVTLKMDDETAQGRLLPAQSAYPDLMAAQSFLIGVFDPDPNYRDDATPRPAVVPIAASILPRRARERSTWRGGPKRGTHFATALEITDFFEHRYGTSGLIEKLKLQSPAHLACYEAACEAAAKLREAQSVSRKNYAGARQEEMSYRGKGKRALDRAKALFEPIRVAARQADREAMPTAVSDVIGSTRDLEVALQLIEAKGFREIGAGHHAVVYGRGRIDTIRAGNGVDGFFRQLVAAAGPLAPFVGLHAPVVLDVLLTDDGGAVALVERLDPLPDEGDAPELDEVVEQAIAALRGIDRPSRELDERYPRFREYARTLRESLPTVDYRRENLMLRHGNLIANDPCGRGFLESELDTLRAIIPLLPFEPAPRAEKWWDETPRASLQP